MFDSSFCADWIKSVDNERETKRVPIRIICVRVGNSIWWHFTKRFWEKATSSINSLR